MSVEKNYDLVAIYGNNAGADAFGRLRVSEPQALHDGKNIFGDDPKFWASTRNVVYGTLRTVFEDAKAVLDVEAPATTDDYDGRITRQSFSYQAGRSQRTLLTGIFNVNAYDVASDGSAVLTYGLGDSMKYDSTYGKLPDNGIVFVREKINGVENTRVLIRRKRATLYNKPISEWTDKLDGKGASKITVNWAKAQITDLDFEWLGVGRLRFSLNIDGQPVPIFEINNANNTDIDASPYMLMPNLRVFYGAFAKGGATESSRAQTVQICSSVQSESGSTFLGVKRTLRRSAAATSVGTTFTSILAARIATDKIGTIAKYFGGGVFTTDTTNYEYAVVINPILTNNNETWDSQYLSNVEYSSDINDAVTAAANSTGIILNAGFASSTNQGRTFAKEKFDSALNLGHDGYDNPDEIHLLVRTLSGTASFWGLLDIEEGY